MVENLIRTGYLTSDQVRQAMLSVDRGLFVPKERRGMAYEDLALPVGHGQTISAPSVVAFMLEKLEIKKGMKVLEVGTGSGYNCALLSNLVGNNGRVISIDILPELIENAEKNIEKAKPKTRNWTLVAADGSEGYPPQAPYERIIVTAAMPYFNGDHPLAKQLTGNGKLIAPVGTRAYQDLVLFERQSGSMEKVLPVIFVPLVGKSGFKSRPPDTI